jgi:hypothetical protein
MTLAAAIFLVMFVFFGAWISFRIGTLRAVMFSNSENEMMSYLISSTIKWTLIGMLCWAVIPMGWIITHTIALRFVFTSLVDWHTVCDNYDLIKQDIKQVVR